MISNSEREWWESKTLGRGCALTAFELYKEEVILSMIYFTSPSLKLSYKLINNNKKNEQSEAISLGVVINRLAANNPISIAYSPFSPYSKQIMT